MSFETVQAAALLSTVPWIQDGSFQNMVFEWLKLRHQHPQCKKKQDYEKILEDFRNKTFNRFVCEVHRRTANTTEDENAFVKLVCASTPKTGKEHVQLFQQLDSFKRVLEPIMGGHSNRVPVLLLWVLTSPSNLNELWYKDEVDAVRDSGVCVQCSGTKQLTPVFSGKLRCPATMVSLCGRGCPMPEASSMEAMLSKTSPYALTHFGATHQQMLSEMCDMLTLFVQRCVGGEEPRTVYNHLWTTQHAQHSETINTVIDGLKKQAQRQQETMDTVVGDLNQQGQRQQAVLRSCFSELRNTKIALTRAENRCHHTQQELHALKQQSDPRSRVPRQMNTDQGRQHHYEPHPRDRHSSQYVRQQQYPQVPTHQSRWGTWHSASNGTLSRGQHYQSPDVLPYQPPQNRQYNTH